MIKWRMDPQEVAKARKILGLAHPVSFHRLHDPDGDWGAYDIPLHSVWVNSTIEDPAEVSYTYWHELGHAYQCEQDYNGNYVRFCDDVWDGYRHANVLEVNPDDDEWYKRYYTVPFELEADHIATRYAEKYPLIRVQRVVAPNG